MAASSSLQHFTPGRTERRDSCCLPRPWETSWKTRNLSPSVLGRRGKGHEKAAGFAKPASPAVVGQLPFCIAGPPPSSSSHRPGDWARFVPGCLWAGHSPSAPPHRLLAGTDQGAAKRGAGEGGGEEGWEMFSHRSTTEATTSYNLILHGCGSSRILKKSSFAA